MMTTILVPTDFSTTAKKAVEYAVTVAKTVSSRVVILHLYQIPVASATRPVVLAPEIVQENIQQAEQQLRMLEREVPGLKEINYITKTLPVYWLIEIPEIINEQKADLIIMGTNGASGLKELMMGSNTASVINSATCPVLAVPSDAECNEINKIAFGYDREFVDNFTTFDFLKWFAKQFNKPLEIFHIEDSGQEIDSKQHTENIKKFKDYMGDSQHSYTEIPGDNIEKGIHDYLEEKNIDLLALMHRSRGLFEKLFRTSITQKMAYHSSTPLLVIPEK